MAAKLILDMDPGIDDAIALITALSSEAVQVLGVTTVAGNLSLDTTTANASSLLALMAADIRVYPGAAAPLYGCVQNAADVHGEQGLGNWRLSRDLTRIEQMHAVDFMAQAIAANPGEVTLVATGPLTNVAMLLEYHPEEARQLKNLVFMGGAVSVPGNVTPTAEFNIYIDPDSAQLVLNSGLDLTMVGLDVTHQVQLLPKDLPALRSLGVLGSGVAAMLEHYFQWAGPGRGCPLHDPLAVLAVLRPEWFDLQLLPVQVAVESKLTRGQTVADFKGQSGWAANVRVAMKVDAPACLAYLNSLLSRS